VNNTGAPLHAASVAEHHLSYAKRSAPAASVGTLLALLRVAALAVLIASVASCSLISLKSPEKPLSTRDLNARILTHEYSAHFIAAVEQSADQIAAAPGSFGTRQHAALEDCRIRQQ
jgi:hypothetical protein